MHHVKPEDVNKQPPNRQGLFQEIHKQKRVPNMISQEKIVNIYRIHFLS